MSYCWNWEESGCGRKICCHDCPEKDSCDVRCAGWNKEKCIDYEDEDPSEIRFDGKGRRNEQMDNV